MIVTVTLNAALDRSLTVPTLQLGQRHRASEVLTLAGGKGINVARALKRLEVPVVATGLAGGRTGTRIVEELTGEAILNDFVRIRDESRTSTLVVDPTSGRQTEINEWGPKVSEAELGMLMDKLRYLSRGADAVVFAGSLPRGVSDTFYADAASTLQAKRDLLSDGLRTAGFAVSRPSGSYFVIADAAPLGVDDAEDFCRRLPGLVGVVGIPLTAFVHPDRRAPYRSMVRFAFCKRTEVLAEAAERLAGLPRS